MKRISALTLLYATLLNGDTIERIDSIVSDISHLQHDYRNTKEEKERYAEELKSVKVENTNLTASYEDRIKNLESEIKRLQKEIQAKENSKNKNQKFLQKCLNTQSLDDANRFPKLELKDAFTKRNVERVVYFKASTFRMKRKAFIYDSVKGEPIEEWEDATSFTSNQKTEHWIKITGVFKNRVWQAAQQEMWVKVEDVMLRKGSPK